jgi:hypothetical protein
MKQFLMYLYHTFIKRKAIVIAIPVIKEPDYKPHDLAFSWVIEVEHGTVLETCAIDALLTVIHIDGDFYTYATNDKLAWVDFKEFESARKGKIRAEKLARYA